MKINIHLLSFSLLLFLSTLKNASASFCGNAAIPYSFEATKTGQPVLGCARPSCFGWTSEGKALSSEPAFYRVQKRPDGFLRKEEEGTHRKINLEVAENFRSQSSKCPTTFEHEQCPRDDQWVGGIAPVTNVSGLPLALQCCSYDNLRLADDRGVAVVNQGQMVVGGEVYKDGRQYAFDYISDIVKHVKSDGQISYDISLRRFPCLPQPPEYVLEVDDSVYDKLIEKSERSIEKITSKSHEDAPTAHKIQHKHYKPQEDSREISVEQVSPRKHASRHQKDSYEEPQKPPKVPLEYKEVWDNDKRRHESHEVDDSEEEKEHYRHQHHHKHHRHQSSEETPSSEIEKFKEKLIMELGEKLLSQNQNNVTYPPVNPTVQAPPQVLNDNILFPEGDVREESKAKAHGVETQEGSENIFENKEIRRSWFYPVGGNCGSCNCQCQTCSCVSSCCHGYTCFTGDTKVRTVNGHTKRMDQLSLNDWVLSPNKTKMIFTPMETWVHRLPSAYTQFIKFTLEDGKTLKITHKHFIYKSKCSQDKYGQVLVEDLPINPVYAEKVDVEDCLYVIDKTNHSQLSQSKVIKKEYIYEKGLYAPMTVTSDIVVNDIVASCYNIINHREMQFSFFHNVKKLARWSKSIYGDVNNDELDIPSSTSYFVDILQYILPDSIIPSY